VESKMNPTMNPSGTLSQLDQSNPLVASATGQPTDQTGSASPTATDTAQSPGLLQSPTGTPRPPVNSGASLAQRLPNFQSDWNAKYSEATKRAMDAGLSPLAAQVVGATHANDPHAPTSTGQKVLGGAKAILGNLGDAAAVGTVPPGGGALEGVTRTLGARNQRIQEQDKNRVAMAEANTRMIHEQRLISKLDDEAKQASVDSGQKQIQFYRSQPSPAPALAEHLDSDQVNQFIQEKKLDPTKETAIPDGVKIVGTDKNGNPIKRMTYTLMGVPADVTLDKNYAGSKDILEELNKYAPPANGGGWTEGQHFTGTEFNLAMQHAADVRAATLARNQSLIGNKIADEKQVRDLEAVNFRGVSDWVNALSQTPNGDVMAARSAMLASPEMRKKYPNLDNDLREYYGKDDKGTSNYDKLLEKHQERIDQNIESIIGIQKDLDKAHGEEAASIAAGLQARISNPSPQDQAQLPRLQRMLNQANQQAKASLDFEAKKKQQDQNIQNAVDEEDMPILVQAADNYQLDPNKLYSMRKNTNAKFKAEMLKKDPTWSEAKYKQRYNMQIDLASDKQNSLGGQVESLNKFSYHTGNANRGIQGLRNLNSPWLNKPLNSIKEGTVGFPEAQSLTIELEMVKDEFLNFTKNGHVPPTAQEERLAQAANTSKTPAELQSVFRAMAQLVADRGKSMNGRYSTIMGGGSIPGLLQPDSENILRQFGVDTDAIYNTTSTTSVSRPINKTPAQQKSEANLPPPAKGFSRIRTPKGTIMDLPEDQAKIAAANGATVIH
jgi:hypothetical protein